MNEMDISNPKISLTNFIETAQNPPGKNTLEIVDSRLNIQIEKNPPQKWTHS